MLARLLWQTWRENWLLLLAPLGVALLLIAGVGAVIGLTEMRGEASSFALTTTLLFTPSLYGAVVFYADQRRGNYRFLAEHAARPRLIWLARHIVWLGALIVARPPRRRAHFVLRQPGRVPQPMAVPELSGVGAGPIAATLMYETSTGVEIAVRIAVVSAFASLVAYGIGQFFSMCLHSNPGRLPLSPNGPRRHRLGSRDLPLATFALAISASTLHRPHARHLASRTRLDRRPKFLAHLVETNARDHRGVAFVLTTLPSARLGQFAPAQHRSDRNREVARNKQAFANRIAYFRDADTTEAAHTADLYTRMSEKLAAGTGQDPLERWRKTRIHGQSRTRRRDRRSQDSAQPVGCIPEGQAQNTESIKQLLASVVKESIEISKRPTCRFHFDSSFYGPTYTNMPPDPAAMLSKNRTEHYLDQLIGVVAGEPMSTPDDPIHRFLAALRMGRHFRSGQPTRIVISKLKGEQNILKRISDWAQEDGRTKAELHEAPDSLTAILHSPSRRRRTAGRSTRHPQCHRRQGAT